MPRSQAEPGNQAGCRKGLSKGGCQKGAVKKGMEKGTPFTPIRVKHFFKL